MPETESFEAKAQSEMAPVAPQRIPHRRNQLFAVAIVGLVATVFVTVLGLVVLLHYAETHHMLAAL